MRIGAFHMQKTKTAISPNNRFMWRLFNDTIYVKFRVCFTIDNYENGIISLCDTSIAFIHALCHSKMHLHQRGPLELIKTMLKSYHILLSLFPVWISYPKGSTRVVLESRRLFI